MISIRPITPAIGAEVTGVDLREPLTPAEVETLEQALLDPLALFFRNQNITPAQQLAFGRRFGGG